MTAPEPVVYLGLGTNVGDREQNLGRALEFLGKKISALRRAPLYETKAVGFVDQANFLNTVVAGQTTILPEELLQFVKQIEKAVGRVERFHWGPREIDIDILFYGDQVIDSPDLTIPHPRLTERDFALQPLFDLNPNFVHPGNHQTVADLLAAIPPQARSVIKKFSAASF